MQAESRLAPGDASRKLPSWCGLNSIVVARHFVVGSPARCIQAVCSGCLALPGRLQALAFVDDSIAPERFGEIERLVGGGVDRLLLPPRPDIRDTSRNGDIDLAAVDRDHALEHRRLDTFDPHQTVLGTSAADDYRELL